MKRHCPRCGNDLIFVQRRRLVSGMRGPRSGDTDEYQCQGCGHRWEKPVGCNEAKDAEAKT